MNNGILVIFYIALYLVAGLFVGAVFSEHIFFDMALTDFSNLWTWVWIMLWPWMMITVLGAVGLAVAVVALVCFAIYEFFN